MWRLHRNDPGWLVGEHMQVFRWGLEGVEMAFLAGTKEMERLGEVGRLSRENRTEAEGAALVPAKWTRVGDVDRWKKVEEEKDEEEEAK